jgi:hypothetical protein
MKYYTQKLFYISFYIFLGNIGQFICHFEIWFFRSLTVYFLVYKKFKALKKAFYGNIFWRDNFYEPELTPH